MNSIYDNNVSDTLASATSAAANHGQTFINTARIFSSAFAVFALGRDDPDITKLNDGIIDVMKKFNITLTDFNQTCKEKMPSSSNAISASMVSPSPDVNAVIDHLTSVNQSEQRIQTMADLMSALFLDRTYVLHDMFMETSARFKKNYDDAITVNTAADKLPPVPFDVETFYSEMNKFLGSQTSWKIPSLESDAMKKYVTNLNAKIADDKEFRFVGMNDVILGLEVALGGRTTKSAMLVGPAGTGKTAAVYELAHRIVTHNVPSFLSDVIIYELHLDALVAGASFVGQYEERFRDIMDPISKLKNVIIFIDEIHAATRQASATYSTSDLLKPYLSRGDIWAIGATTDKEYNEYIQPDKAVARRFNKVNVREPTKDEMLEIMRGVNKIDEIFFNKTLKEELLERIYNLANDYNMAQANPAKALQMLEAAYAYSRVMKEKDIAVTVDDIMHSLELKYGIHIYENRLEKTTTDLNTQLLGQHRALGEVARILTSIDLHIVDSNKPRAVMLLAGPTGVGKTETAKIIAKDFTGSDNNLVVIPGNELQEDTGVTSLFGSDPGYIGFKETSDFLDQIQQKPNCVVLFDEIEKANPAIFKSLLQILDEGYAVDKGGNRISFRNTIIIFTTNLGFGTTHHNGSGLMYTSHSDDLALDTINKFFSPEFIGRLEGMIFYDALTDDIADTLIERYRKFYAESSGIDIAFTPEQIATIKKTADITSFGARELNHAVQKAYIETVYAERFDTDGKPKKMESDKTNTTIDPVPEVKETIKPTILKSRKAKEEKSATKKEVKTND